VNQLTKARLIYLLVILAMVAFFIAKAAPATGSDGNSYW
jgi:heme O synthase-like polyprenyltransferase